MRIGIDARFYGPDGKGLGRYTQRLIENLEKIDTTNEYIIFLSKQNWADYQPKNPRFTKVVADCRWYTLWEQLLMPYLIGKNKIELMHFPHFNVAVFCPTRFVVTIHDLILLKYPTRRATTLDPVRYWIKQLGYRFVINRALSRSKKIISVSEFTKQDILQNFSKVPADKIAVTHEACDSVETGQLKLPGRDLKQFGITKPYLLYVGNAYPHKNLERLMQVFRQLDSENQGKYQLVLVGREDYFYSRLKEYSAGLDFKTTQNGDSPVVFFGFAKQEMLADLYRNARLYVFPSLLEGFGLPPLEAMRYDLPVTASGNSSCPEILGQAAIYFDPQDNQSILEAIKKVLADESLRLQLIANGREQIKKYSWAELAQLTLAVYRQAG